MDSLEDFVKIGKKCIGIGANYYSFLKAFDKEVPEVPLIFLKATSSYVTDGQTIMVRIMCADHIPKGFTIINQEIELGVVIGKKCKNVCEEEAMECVGGYCAALDMTAICQMKPGNSWTLAKSFDTACPVSKFIEKEKIPDPHNVNLWSAVNGKRMQNDNTRNLVFNIPYLIAYVSKYFTLDPGDLIITGSPIGMGPVKKGDVIEAGLEGIVSIRVEVDEE